ncbi:PHP domain-containing protein [Methanohalophilus portucalensis]|uniref:PHP domain protein n=2 Tax=Methanohalophilus portucalensis TaxID=39664 RepID=A0A1L9C4B7_9EURY|nr:PHP domain-containing protein [Methanohalophilus portucalensis]ATU07806.1 histidinol-phosphatase [Methanohalophilus portucalensis]OJH49374.1 PHP domain protein [Methanohalophilus portucalensis FDF-1]RNI11518.1 PHP domain-containing protein [Methanohalophilus portucalensis FDF-1]SMH41260.1 hypothetical protein SAMN06264941_1627 [Methanohalophilus portucalensis FDF-1]
MLIDLHVHSCFSKDSDSQFDSILEWAKKNGMGGVAICDHDSVEGGFACARRALEIASDILVIPGQEVSSAEGHVLVLGASESVPASMSVHSTIEYAHDRGGLVIIPHPYKKTSHGIGYLKGLDVDAVEVFNSRCLTPYANTRAKIVAERLGLPQVGGSDAHEPCMVGRSYTDIDVEDESVDSVLSAIKAGRVKPGGKLTPQKYVVGQMFRGIRKKININ